MNFIGISRYYDIVRDVRQNKGSILKASVDYIRKLKADQAKRRQLEEKVREQEVTNRKLLLKLQVRTLKKKYGGARQLGQMSFFLPSPPLHESTS